MSRYEKTIGNFEYAWGFDPPLSEYFFQKFDATANAHQEDVMFSISSHHTLTPHPKYPKQKHFTNSEMLTIIKEEEDVVGEILPAEHKEAIAFDIEF